MYGSIASSIAQIVGAASEQAELGRDDFIGDDGLIYCGVCKNPKQCKTKFPWDDKPRIVACDCGCKQAAYEKRKKEIEKMNRDNAIKEMAKESLLDESLKNAKFGDLIVNEENAEQFELCRKYVMRFDKMYSENVSLLMYGGVGTGKTYMAACIANNLIARGYPVVMTSFVKLINMTAQFDSGNQEVLNRIARAKLLVIDDLGAERSTDYALEKIFDIVDGRYRNRKPVIYTTNISLDEMRETEDIRYRRIYDRIIQYCLPIKFTGKSWRVAEAKKRYDEMRKMLL